MNDHISDMFARLKNAYLANKSEVTIPHTKVCAAIATVLVAHKYLVSATTKEVGNKSLHLVLNYVDGVPSLSHCKRVSKPGVRIYQKSKNLKPILSGDGLAIVSTSQGIMAASEARKKHLGGEVLVELW